MAHGPRAGLEILDPIAAEGRLDQWPQLHIARAELLRQLDQGADALIAYKAALAAGLPEAERTLIARRMAQIVTS
jgi:RNA polymerase sigma-70 factor (ECF subfamily)